MDVRYRGGYNPLLNQENDGDNLMSYINKYLRNFKPYNVASHKIWKVDPKDRKNILKLDWNEGTISPAPQVTERLKKLISTGFFLNLYPSTNNNRIIELLSEYTGLSSEYLQYFASSDSLEEYISKLFITVGDPVLLLWPSYDNFRLTAQVAGAHVMFYEMNEDFQFNPEDFEKKIDRKNPSLVYICNPNNPTGTQLQPDYIEHLLKKYDQTVFLIDEAYWEFSGITCQELVTRYDNILISRTMSKAFALANIRFGYLISSRENIEFVSSIRNPKNITTFAQEAVIGALENTDYMWNYVKQVRIARDYFVQAINALPGEKFNAYETQGNFALVQCCDQLTKQEILTYLQRNNIFIRDLQQSEIVKNCVRVSIGTMDQMKRVVHVFDEYCQRSYFFSDKEE